MKYHAVVNMEDAIEIARIFREEGVFLKRKRKGLWWLYSRDSILDMMYSVTDVEPNIVLSISRHPICEPGQMLIIDAEKALPPLQSRANIKIEPLPQFPLASGWAWRYGYKGFKYD
jgi:hypothetical protein